MRRLRFVSVHPLIVPALCVALLTGSSWAVAALQSVPTEEEYGALMTEIRFTVGDVELHVDSRYWPETREDLDKLVPMFEQVEAFWTARGADDAVGFATQALAALNDLGDAAVGQDLGGARAAITALRSTCGSCHENHREQTDDGYRIKSGS